MVKDKVVKDKLALEFNPLTGKFDLVSKFNANRIVTHQLNQAGNPLYAYDVQTGTYLLMDPLVVTDDEGNVVVVGC